MSATIPKVAPWQSCIKCFRGDVDTGFVVQGSLFYVIGRTSEVTGLTWNEVASTVGRALANDDGQVDVVGPHGVIVRVCESCMVVKIARGSISKEALSGWVEGDTPETDDSRYREFWEEASR